MHYELIDWVKFTNFFVYCFISNGCFDALGHFIATVVKVESWRC